MDIYVVVASDINLVGESVIIGTYGSLLLAKKAVVSEARCDVDNAHFFSTDERRSCLNAIQEYKSDHFTGLEILELETYYDIQLFELET